MSTIQQTLNTSPAPETVVPEEIRVKGKTIFAPSIHSQGRTVISTGNWLRIARVKDEELVNGPVVGDPEALVNSIRNAGLPADLFVFTEKPPVTEPRFNYYCERDNVAAIEISSYDAWLKSVEYDVRKAIKKADKLGVRVEKAEYSDAFVRGIIEIYNDTPVRQGKAFWHFNKDFETVKHENGTYLGRSEFIGAYFEGELIGFIKMVYVDSYAATLQVISKTKHFDKKPTNALIAKAVQISAEKGLSHFVYGKYRYHDQNSSLTEFKRRSGFREIPLPRYYIPITKTGAAALKMNAHHGLGGMIPKPLLGVLRQLRHKKTEIFSRARSTSRRKDSDAS